MIPHWTTARLEMVRSRLPGAESRLLASPDDNVTDDVARNFIQNVIGLYVYLPVMGGS